MAIGQILAGNDPRKLFLTVAADARDSSVKIPDGAIITATLDWWRRGENYAAIRAYEAASFQPRMQRLWPVHALLRWLWPD